MKAGLEDIIAGESAICYIDGEKGILAYRGYNIHELATNSTFEETCHLLWFGRLPKHAELDDTSKKLTSARVIPQQVIDYMKTLPNKALPMACGNPDGGCEWKADEGEFCVYHATKVAA